MTLSVIAAVLALVALAAAGYMLMRKPATPKAPAPYLVDLAELGPLHVELKQLYREVMAKVTPSVFEGVNKSWSGMTPAKREDLRRTIMAGANMLSIGIRRIKPEDLVTKAPVVVQKAVATAAPKVAAAVGK
jgi:hypothetical protein